MLLWFESIGSNFARRQGRQLIIKLIMIMITLIMIMITILNGNDNVNDNTHTNDDNDSPDMLSVMPCV